MNYKEIANTLFRWIKNISTIDYYSLAKNFVVAILLIVVYFLFGNLHLILSAPLFVGGLVLAVLLLFMAVHLISELMNRRFNKKAEKEEIKSVKQRMLFQEKINNRLEECLHTLNADRIFIEECHNSLENFGGLGFVKFTMSYELVNNEKPIPVPYISNSYCEQQATLYKMPMFIKRNGFIQGTVQDICKIDRRYGLNMDNEGDKYSAYILLQGQKDKPIIGWVGISWKDVDNLPDKETIKDKMADLAKDISPLFQLMK